MTFDPKVVVAAAVALVVVIIILSAPTIPIQVVQNKVSWEPYSFEQQLVRTSEVRKFTFPWFSDVTQAQYLVTNKEPTRGKFALNFTFNNGTEIATRSVKQSLGPGERRAVIEDSSLVGKSDIHLDVSPPSKPISTQVTVAKTISVFDCLGQSALDFVFGLR